MSSINSGAPQECKDLFNYKLTNTETIPYVTFGIYNYEINTGNYIGPNNRFIVSGYKGEWIIIKFPYEIILTKFRFYMRLGIFSRLPALWKCYGSIDGITFVEIIEGSNDIDINALISDNYSETFYEKTLLNNKTQYSYIGITINKLVGGDTNSIFLNISELQFFGREKIYYSKIDDDIRSNILNTKIDTNYSTTGNDPNYLKLSSGGNITGSLTTTGNIGIGTSTNLNSNLTVQGSSLFNNIASFSNSYKGQDSPKI